LERIEKPVSAQRADRLFAVAAGKQHACRARAFGGQCIGLGVAHQGDEARAIAFAHRRQQMRRIRLFGRHILRPGNPLEAIRQRQRIQ